MHLKNGHFSKEFHQIKQTNNNRVLEAYFTESVDSKSYFYDFISNYFLQIDRISSEKFQRHVLYVEHRIVLGREND